MFLFLPFINVSTILLSPLILSAPWDCLRLFPSPHSWPENPTTTTTKPLASASSFRPNANERRSVTTGPRLFSSLFPSKFWRGFSGRRVWNCGGGRTRKAESGGKRKEGRKEGRALGRTAALRKGGERRPPFPPSFQTFLAGSDVGGGALSKRRRSWEGERRFVQFHGRRRRGKEEKALSLRLCQGRPNSSSFLWRRLRLNLIGLLLPLLLTRRKEKGGARLVFLLRRFETIGAGEFNGP